MVFFDCSMDDSIAINRLRNTQLYDWNVFFYDGSHLANMDECNCLFNQGGRLDD